MSAYGAMDHCPGQGAEGGLLHLVPLLSPQLHRHADEAVAVLEADDGGGSVGHGDGYS